ncbi:aldo/keto reductase [Bacteroides sp.]|uniref:aldo/keto reductase n=1 Tax=Bacteroides sp. TaxID=29523 RepID=UPI00263006B7|nr:aldo/keto reductase [Bacteroides sp.]MDD3037796.1 aldo/keto reductase [Bacteroides sp.]
MEYRILGNTGLSVSVIALGCEGFIGKKEEQVCSEMDFAISKGINFIDLYSSNPELRSHIGKALSGHRQDFIIQGHLCATWENDQYLRTRNIEKTLASFEDQMTRLQTDYLDIGMIHYVDSEQDLQDIFDGPIIQLALRLKQEGRIRYIGLSSHNPAVALLAVKSGLIDVLMFSINPCYDLQPPSENVDDLWADENYERPMRNIAPERERLYELCEKRGVGLDVMKVYGGGDLLSEKNSPFGKAMTPVQCLEYALTRPGVDAVMVGCKSCEEIQAAVNWCVATKEEKDYTQVMSGMDKFSWQGHCMYCGHCAPCSVGIDIASVNKYYNLTNAQDEIPETVREHYKVLTHHASECIGCGQCEANCPFGVSIIQQMQMAVERFGY